MSPRRHAVGITALVASAVCALGLGRAGLWPGELAALEPGAPPGVAGTLARLAIRVLGASDTAVRLPGALLAVGAAVALAWAVARVLDARAGAYTGVVYATLPLVTQNARAVSDAGAHESLAAMAFALTLVALWSRPAGSPWRRLARLVVCAPVVLITVWHGGALAVLPVLAGAALAVALRAREAERMAGAALGVAAVGLGAWVLPHALASVPGAPSHTFDALIEPLAHVTLPWTGLVVFGLAGLLAPPPTNAPEGSGALTRESGARATALATTLVAFVLGSALPSSASGASLGLAAPLALAVAVLLRDAEREPRAARAAALGAVLALLIGLRDVALFPASAYDAIAHLAPPPAVLRSPGAWLAPPSLAAFASGAAPLTHYVALALVPFALVAFIVLALGARRARLALIPAAAVFAALVSAHLLGPALARRLSPRDAFGALGTLRAAGEPAARFADQAPAAPRWYAHGEVRPLATESDALAWLLAPAASRRWLVLGDDALGSLNRGYRRAAGRNVPIAQDTGAGLLVAVSDVAWPSRNPLDAIVSDHEPAEGPAFRPLPGGAVVFDDAVELLGVDLARAPVPSGGAFEPRWHFHALRELPGAWQVFVHVDGPCARIHGEHEPAAGSYPVRDWLAGDHVLDAQRVAIPAWCPRGEYTAYVGLFQGERRARVRGGEHTPDDRVVGAVFDVR